MRFRLRTLLILLAVGPPVLAGTWLGYRDYCERQRVEREREIELVLSQLLYGNSVVWQWKILDDLPAESEIDCQ